MLPLFIKYMWEMMWIFIPEGQILSYWKTPEKIRYFLIFCFFLKRGKSVGFFSVNIIKPYHSNIKVVNMRSTETLRCEGRTCFEIVFTKFF